MRHINKELLEFVRVHGIESKYITRHCLATREACSNVVRGIGSYPDFTISEVERGIKGALRDMHRELGEMKVLWEEEE